jgi:hypothetical protein
MYFEEALTEEEKNRNTKKSYYFWVPIIQDWGKWYLCVHVEVLCIASTIKILMNFYIVRILSEILAEYSNLQAKSKPSVMDTLGHTCWGENIQT